MMDRFWLKSYPRGIPATIDVDPELSIIDVFKETVAKYPKNPAVSNFGFELTYEELDQRSDHFAAFLINNLGLEKGDRFGIMMPNVIQYLVAMYGAFKAGLVVVNVNPMYTADEVRHQLNDAGVRAMIVLENFAHTIQEAFPHINTIEHIIVTGIGDAFPRFKRTLYNWGVRYLKRMVPAYHFEKSTTYLDAMALGSKKSFEPIDLVGSDLAFLQYTGGTTGVAKGAMLSHYNMVANLLQAATWSSHFLKPGKEIIITALPLYHIFSLLANALVFMRFGALNVLITNPRDINGFVKEMSRYPFTAITAVNTLFNALVNNKRFAKLNFSRLHFTMGGGMSVHRTVAEKWQKITGVHILEAYGLTETSPAAFINPVYCRQYNGSIGLPIPSTDVKVIDEDGHTLPVGEAGELCIKGPQVMQGYWNMPDETEAVLSEEGWLKTGDVAKFDEKGFAYIVDRKKDMIVVSGFNVYPNEVEAVLIQHPAIQEVAVIGVDNETTGEAVKAFIKLQPGQQVKKEALIKFCRRHLTPYKVPKQYEFCDELPKSNVGKILRRALRDQEKNKD